MMVQRILVPLEKEGGAEAHLRYAAKLAARLEAELVLLHIIPVVASEEYFFRRIQVEEGSKGARRKAEAESYLGRLGERLQAQGLSVKTEILVTDQPEDEAIADYAARSRSELIVLPNLRRSLLSRWLQGNIPARVQRRSYIPILLVSEEEEQ